MPYFNAFSQTGYNMIHFAPLNTRGSSNSPYSIYDQLSLSDDLFDSKLLTKEEKELELKTVLEHMFETCGLLSVTDVVWNHTACNSFWLQEHPESGYNLKNSPHLRSANELDEAILSFSEDFKGVYGLEPELKTEEQLLVTMNVFKNQVLIQLKLWEFYVIQVKESAMELAQNWRYTQETSREIASSNPYQQINLSSLSLKEKANLLSQDGLISIEEGHRYAKQIKLETGLCFMEKLVWEQTRSFSLPLALKEYETILNEINLDFYKEYDQDVESIIMQMTNRARYLRVAEHGPRLGSVCKR
jgi:glycogen debranching enzyme